MLSECRCSRPQAACASCSARLDGIATKIVGITHQLQFVDLPIVVDVLEDVPVRKPGTDDAKRGNSLRDSEEGYHVWMRNTFPLYDLVMESLVKISLHSPYCQNTITDPFDRHWDIVDTRPRLSLKRLNGHPVSTYLCLPNLRKLTRGVGDVVA